MSEADILDSEIPTTTDVMAVVASNPLAVLTDEKQYSEFYRRVKEEVSAFQPDVSTEKGRKEIARLAYKVTRSKTAIDDAGKKLNEEARAKINVVDASRRKIREELTALAAEVRKPLTDWEEEQQRRQEEMERVLGVITSAATVGPDDTSAQIETRITDTKAIAIDPAIFGDVLSYAEDKRNETLTALEQAFTRAKTREDEQAELARLRAEQAEREKAEREVRERAEQEQADKERREREAAEAKRREEEIAEHARLEAERAAKAEKQRIESEAREKVEKAEAEARAIKETAEREERERQEQIERTKREEEARQKDREHRGRLMGDAKDAVIACGVEEEVAKRIVLAIVAGEVPHVSLKF